MGLRAHLLQLLAPFRAGEEVVPGARLVLDALGFAERIRDSALVVTGEGEVDRTSAEGKATGEVVHLCTQAGVRCAVFGGRVLEPLPGAETHALSGDPARAEEDLVALGEELGRSL